MLFVRWSAIEDPYIQNICREVIKSWISVGIYCLILTSMLTNLKAVVWMVSICPPNFNSPIHFPSLWKPLQAHQHQLVLLSFSCLWRCPWCNGYRRRKWTRRHFKSWTRMIAFHIALIPLGKVWIQLFSLQLCLNIRTDCVLQPWWGN